MVRKNLSGVHKYISILASTLFVGLALLSGVGLYLSSKSSRGVIIAADVERIAKIMQEIHADCKIISFDEQQTIVDFLNVGCFAGSKVGSINLAYPNKWQGPYLKENPTIHEKSYMIVTTDNGIFVTPGNGVKLPSRKKIGTDIVLDKHADIHHLITSGVLQYNGRPLAAQLYIK